MIIYKKRRNNSRITTQKGFNDMKKLICLMAVFMLLFTACGTNDVKDNTGDAPNGVVEDGDGIIDEAPSDDDSLAENISEGTKDVVDGASDATKRAVDGVENAADDMMGKNKNNNSMK